MEATELRIGNHIERHNKVNGEKDIIQVDGGTPLLAFEGMTLLEFNPIPLTEEWLLKFGFEDVTGVNYILHIDSDFKLLLIPADGFYPQIDKADDSGWQSVSLNKIEYVHQLQNLYFALTGEELEINLTQE